MPQSFMPNGSSTLTTNPFDDDKLREECGVFGIFGSPDATAHTALGLHALQHRGQEAAGITSLNGQEFTTRRVLGQVADNFTSQEVIDSLPGNSAIGHVRYSTTGETILRNCQPLFAEFSSGGFAVAHNGNLTNAAHLKKQLISRGSIFQSTSDTEVILHLIATSHFRGLMDRFVDALRQLEGAYSLVTLTREGLIGVRDPLGVRPLVLGKLDKAYIMCSETCALDIIGAEYVRDVEPGEVVIVTDEGIKSIKPFPETKPRPCIFEHVYFARPDSFMDSLSVYDVRKRIGAELARENTVDADLVIPVPDSGTPAAIGFAQESGIPFELGIIRNHYVGRTFIEPSDQIRHFGVKLKHNANKWFIEGKKIVLVDDSIVRGTTSLKIVNMMREAGAAEVHMRIASPPTAHSCFYGVDTPERSKLLAGRMDVDAMCEYIKADSLSFLSIDGLYRAVNHKDGRNNSCPAHCDACFTGDYPTFLTDQSEEEEKANQLNLIASTGS
ncbi:amidophosphoribosyltransferase [Kordiimonas sediminis]|uniref:Amidophosphoribosyltransferase n=1 Tax=Kordiimonas sediminis TaxID=1735581 RepID=A0A919AW50_9PROT|nr:amidophosphoribosyltransferase [Kordiimonas sediminis]GHF28867.1 amidophosphoribosyltransferase [Kordiimonas sediminis]